MDNIELVPKLIDHFVESIKGCMLDDVSYYKIQNENDGVPCSMLVDYHGLIRLINNIASDYHDEGEIPVIIEELQRKAR